MLRIAQIRSLVESDEKMTGSNVGSTGAGITRRTYLQISARGLLSVSGAATLGVTADRTDPYHLASSGVEFYVSAAGDDGNDGRRPEQAWRSLDRLNLAIADGTVTYGHKVLLRRGDHFWGQLKAQPPATPPGDLCIEVSSYGDGGPPKISGYKIINEAQAWQQLADDVWRVNLIDGASYSGNVTSKSANTGFLRIDGQIFGAKKWGLGELMSQWDFVNDDAHLYVKSVSHPARMASDLRAAIDGTLVTGFAGLSVDGLDIVGTGGHGYRQTSPGPSSLTNCHVHEIGGARLEGSTRYGNGVELWTGSSDVRVAANKIYDVYDTACTIQGGVDAAGRGIADCSFTSNEIWGCCQAFEYWGTGGTSSPESGFVRCRFSDNVCVGSGFSWSYAVRPDQSGKGNFIMAYGQDVPVDIEVSRNIFFNARDCYQFVNTNDFRLREGYRCDNNLIALRRGLRIQAQMPFTIEQSEEWVSFSGQDAHSRFIEVPSTIENSQDSLDFVRQNLKTLQPS